MRTPVEDGRTKVQPPGTAWAAAWEKDSKDYKTYEYGSVAEALEDMPKLLQETGAKRVIVNYITADTDYLHAWELRFVGKFRKTSSWLWGVISTMVHVLDRPK